MQVAAACLYLVCRQDAKPFLLIDFSDALQVKAWAWGWVGVGDFPLPSHAVGFFETPCAL